jgi:regulator of sigma E protease
VSADLVHSLLSNVWSIALIILFFGGSIFVHELGHYLAARSRGVHVEVFSIGFGPPIFSWKGADGTRYQVAWFPIGGFVLLPQIADLGALEGESQVDTARLPPVSYSTKLLVFVAGATFNVLFAFLLACIIWQIGQPENDETTSTTVGYISRTVDLPDGSHVASPAAVGGLQVGDIVREIDGHRITDWDELHQTLATGSVSEPDGSPRTVFLVERAGKPMTLVLHPRLIGDERWRQIGISPGYNLNVHSVAADSIGARAGLLAGDRILRINGAVVMNSGGLAEELSAEPAKPAQLTVLRDDREIPLTFPPRTGANPYGGIEFSIGYHLSHPTPFAQLGPPFTMTIATLWGLINPHSNVGLSKLTGPIGIVHIFHEAADAGIRYVLTFSILININLAILNLLPIPVLDGGQIVFATISRLRGRALPVNFVIGAQSVFMVLLLSMVLYVSVFDVRRWRKDVRDDRAQSAAAAAPAPARP